MLAEVHFLSRRIIHKSPEQSLCLVEQKKKLVDLYFYAGYGQMFASKGCDRKMLL